MPIKINGTNTAANPSITGDDTDTGIVYGSDQIDFSTGGSSKVTLNGSNLGVGVTNPSQKLQLSGNILVPSGGNLYFGDTGCKVDGTAGGSITFMTNSNLAVEIDNTKNLKMLDGNLVISTAGHGIDFSATANSGSSELLADYEEGYWSPTGLDGMSISLQNSSDNASRRYIKIGKQVMAYFDFTFGNLFNTHTARFGGLPYAQATSGHQASAAAAMGFTTKSGDVYLHISGLYPTFFKNSGTAYNYNEVSSNRMAGVLIYTTD